MTESELKWVPSWQFEFGGRISSVPQFEGIVSDFIESGWYNDTLVSNIVINAIFNSGRFHISGLTPGDKLFERIEFVRDRLIQRDLFAVLARGNNLCPPISVSPAVFTYLRITHADTIARFMESHPEGPRVTDG